MAYEPSQKMFKVKNAHGHIFDIPEKNLDAALARDSRNTVVPDDEFNQQPISPGAPQASQTPNLTNQPEEQESVLVRDSKGIVKIPKARLAEAQRRGGVLVNEDTYGQQIARDVKSLVSGAAGSLVDTPTSIYNIPAALSNASNDLTKDNDFEIDPISGGVIQRQPGERPELPLIPSATRAISSSIDAATGGYTETPKGSESRQEAGETIGAVFSPAGVAKGLVKLGAKVVPKVLNALGTTKVPGLVGAGAAGYASSEASQAGYGTAGSIGSGIGAGVATQAALSAANPRSLGKAALSASGFGKKNLNMEALESAKNLNIDLPGAGATKGVLPAFTHQQLSKFPYFGDQLREKTQTASKQFQQAWDNMLDTVGVQKTEDVSKEIKQAYKLMRSAAPETDAVSSAPILEAISTVENEMKTIVYSDPTEKLFKVMEKFKKALAPSPPQLPDGFEKLPKNVQEKILNAFPNDAAPISIKELVRQKTELNKIMRDRNIFDRTDTDSLGFLSTLQDGVNKALEDYGVKNPTFLKALKKANEKFAKVAKRQALDDVFAGKIVDPKTGDVSYHSLLSILNDRKQQKFLQNNLGKSNYKKLEDFINVAKSMDSIKRNNPNPSGTATVGSVIGLVTSLANGYVALPSAAIGGGMVATKLLTSKKFLNVATKFGKEPTEPLAERLSAIIKENTGMTVQEIQKGIGEDKNQSVIRNK